MRARSVLLPLLLLCALAGCARCGQAKSAAAAEELLPASQVGSMVTAPLGAVAKSAAALIERVSQLPGGEQLGDLRKAVAAQLGFDPLTREGLLQAGLDPDRGAALSLSLPEGAAHRPAWTLALPLNKDDVFAQTFDRLARERAGYALRTDEARGEVRIALFAREAGAQQKLAFAVVRGYGVVSRGADPASELAASAARAPAQSLAKDARFAQSRAALGGQDFLVFAPQGSDLPTRVAGRPLPGDVAVGITGTAQGVSARLVAQLPPKGVQDAAQLMPGGGAGMVALLPADAPFRARLGLAPAQLFAHAAQVPALRALFERVGAAAHLDLQRDVLDALAPGAVVALGLSPGVNIGAAVDFGFTDWQHHSPFDTFQLVALAPVADRAKLVSSLSAIAQALPSLSAKAQRAGDDWQVSYAGGAGARFGVRDIAGKPVAYVLGGGIGPEELGKAVPAAAPAPATAVLLDERGLALQLDVSKLSDKLRALPESAYGTGPQAYVARSLVGQVVEPLRPLRATLSAQPNAQGFAAELDVEIAAPPAAATP